ncbi:MAG: AMP-binding protein, partial [Streptosporangiaceae bacterium]
LLMLGNIAPLWEVILATIKLGAVVIPATTLLGPSDIADRIGRGEVRHVITESAQTAKFSDAAVKGEGEAGGGWTPIAVGDQVEGWRSYGDAAGGSGRFEPDGVTQATDPLLLYFTSGTTAQPKLVEHTHASYPAGHLSTMYWLGLQPGDVHLNISSPGWAKHAWSNVFAPWNGGATAFVLGHERFSTDALFTAIPLGGVSTLCAPPTVWRMLIQADLGGCDTASLRECVSAGEPLNPEVIEQVRRAWGITVRDGYGQTETTAQIGNTPGQEVRPGSMGRPLPGYTVTLVDPVTGEPGAEGEICLPLDPAAGRPAGLMTGYQGDPQRAAEAMHGGFYHTGDVAALDADGYITYVGRTDDVFKASDYRISPFELESVLIEHDAVAEAAVVPSPDPVRLAVPKAYVTLAAGAEPSGPLAESILAFARQRLAPYKRVRRLEFGDLPKTISGKIRRVELRQQEDQRHTTPTEAGAATETRGIIEFWEEDFPNLKA